MKVLFCCNLANQSQVHVDDRSDCGARLVSSEGVLSVVEVLSGGILCCCFAGHLQNMIEHAPASVYVRCDDVNELSSSSIYCEQGGFAVGHFVTVGVCLFRHKRITSSTRPIRC